VGWNAGGWGSENCPPATDLFGLQNAGLHTDWEAIEL